MTRPLSLSTAAPPTAKADALVVGAALQDADGPVAADDGVRRRRIAAAAVAGATGKAGRGRPSCPAPGSVARRPDRRVGRASATPARSSTGERVRKAAGAASRAVAGHGKVVSTLSVDRPGRRRRGTPARRLRLRRATRSRPRRRSSRSC